MSITIGIRAYQRVHSYCYTCMTTGRNEKIIAAQCNYTETLNFNQAEIVHRILKEFNSSHLKIIAYLTKLLVKLYKSLVRTLLITISHTLLTLMTNNNMMSNFAI